MGHVESRGATKGVNRSQDGESNVILVADQFELLAHTKDCSVGYVDPVQEGEEDQQT